MTIYVLIMMGLIAVITEMFYHYVKPSRRYTYGRGDRLPYELVSLCHAYLNNHDIKVIKKSANVYDITLKSEMTRFQAMFIPRGAKLSVFVFTCSHEYLYESKDTYKNMLIMDALHPETRVVYDFEKNEFQDHVVTMGSLESATYFK